ncbi:MAG TPA: DNA polymerase III subunit beta [Candidatus Acidoferrales bacterium]|nr:DNA polymerase III subunit beta [Candidatus Acidoferrales bacterium]
MDLAIQQGELLTIQQSDLLFAAGRALGSVPQKSTQPLLTCLLLEADKNSLRVTGTDLEVTTSVAVPCNLRAPARVAVNARHFHDVVRKMPRGPVTLSQAGNQCELRYGDGKGWSRFPLQRPEEFPRLPELKGNLRIQLEGDVLARMIERTGYATSDEPARPQLNGILVHGSEKHVTFAATDGHRLARSTRKGAFGDLDREGVIVPGRVLASVAKFATEATSPVEIRIADGRNHVGFATQVGEYQVQVFARLIDGPYPNYEQVVPKDNPRELHVSRTDLIEAVDIVASHADANTQQIRFSLRGGKFAVSSATADFGAGEQSVEAEYKGEDMEIGYNAKYLLQILRNIPTERVVFRLKTALSAGVIEPLGALPQPEEDLLCLIMPLRLPDAAG